VIENRVLRIIEQKTAEVTEWWKEMYNEELHVSFYSPSINRMMK
jgi:hypothetical protein